tara:strand:- start:5363 stop:5887 length:525 start_codon:yes stop_codon:yes gene_type:complete
MSNIYISRTNQKLLFAKLHLDSLKKAEQGSGWSKHAQIESYAESVLFHLVSAYSAYLREIAAVYYLEPEKISTRDELLEQMEAKGLEAPEAKELSLLAGSDSWLSQLLGAYRACWTAQEREEATHSEHASLSEIQVVQVNPDHASDREVIAQLETWVNSMRELVDRQREGLKEW